MPIPLNGPRWRQKPALMHVYKQEHRVVKKGIYRATDGLDYEIPCGFETNGGSIPRAFWWWMPPFGDSASCAYTLHDFLYKCAEEVPGMTRGKADDLLRESAVAAGQPAARARAAWLAVRGFGWRAWGKYRDEAQDDAPEAA